MSRNVSDNFGFILLSAFQIQLPVKCDGRYVQFPYHAAWISSFWIRTRPQPNTTKL